MLKFLFPIFFLCVSFSSYSATFIAGQDYEIIKDSSINVEKNKETINISEFFSYGCPWCYRLEPSLNQWIKQHKHQIFFKKVPVVFNKDWEYYARAYYVAEALSIEKKITPLLFKTIIEDKQSLNSTQAMINFFKNNGVNADTASSAFTHSPSIDLQVSAGQNLLGRYHITSVPTIVVNEQFKTDLQMAKTQDRLFAILDYLLTQIKTDNQQKK